jgi:zinc transporter 1/2/3
MNLLTLKLFAGLAILSITLISGLLPFYFKHTGKWSSSWGTGEAFAGGVFLGTALFHMLPNANTEFHAALGITTYSYTAFICALGFLGLLLIEKSVLYFNMRFINPHGTIASVLAIVLSIHALTEGAALGINDQFASAAIIFGAIIVHKGSESFALATQLQRNKLSFKKILCIFAVFSLMTPLGIALGTSITTQFKAQASLVSQAIFNALAAGSFLYVAILSHSHADKNSSYFSRFAAMFCGLGLMAVVAIWI